MSTSQMPVKAGGRARLLDGVQLVQITFHIRIEMEFLLFGVRNYNDGGGGGARAFGERGRTFEVMFGVGIEHG